MAPLFSSRRQKPEKVGARPTGQNCKASSLVSRCKKASFGTRSPLPAPLSTHTYRVRVIRAKQIWICAPKALTNHQRTKSQSHGTAFSAHRNTLEASLNIFHPPTLPSVPLSLSVVHVLQASKKHGQPVGSGQPSQEISKEE